MGGRKGRDGIYPATSCIKITGRFGKLKLYNFKIFLAQNQRSKLS